MIYKIATKTGAFVGSGTGEAVVFKAAYDNVETFTDEDSYNARLAQLRGNS